VAIKEYQEEIIFLRKIVEGATDKSYGLQVARLAALPEPILLRAREILANLEQQSVNANDQPSFAPPKDKPSYVQLDLFADKREELLQKLAKQDLDGMTPLEAMQFLAELKEHLP
jgi:DNA mismatch repair protein MutS